MTETATRWATLAADPEFRALAARRSRFQWTVLTIAILYYFLLPAGAAWYPEWFARPILGPVNAGLCFALSQFLVAWGIAWRYARRAAAFDRAAAAIAARASLPS